MPTLTIELPDWIERAVDPQHGYITAEDRVGLAIDLARTNVDRGTGGPFGAAVFDAATGRVVAAGVNLVIPRRNSILHAEIVALMLAHQRIGQHTLARDGSPGHVLAASCDPCAMCLGAVLWSGVGRLLCGATRHDALSIGFDEGPVFPESHRYLESRGVAIERGIRREEARAVLETYARRGGPVY